MDQLLSKAAIDILSERQRQKVTYTFEHDDVQTGGQLSFAAASYAVASTSAMYEADKAKPTKWDHSYIPHVDRLWPWNWTYWKPRNRRHDLVRAGALILAEIERLDRADGARRP
jgi:hypothetical protein